MSNESVNNGNKCRWVGVQDYLMDFAWGGEQFPSLDAEKASKDPSGLLPLDGECEVSDEVSSHNEDGYESSHDLDTGPRPKKVKTEAERRKAR